MTCNSDWRRQVANGQDRTAQDMRRHFMTDDNSFVTDDDVIVEGEILTSLEVTLPERR